MSEENKNMSEWKPDLENNKSEKGMINLTLKTQKNSKKVNIEVTSTIKDLKEVAANIFDAEASRLQLIFAGKSLKDQDTLQFYNIKDGSIVYLIIKNPVSQTADFQTPSNPYGLDNSRLLSSLQNLHMPPSSFTNLADNVTETQSETLQSILNNPVLSGLTNDPDTVRLLLMANPQIQEIMNRHPEINHLLNNRELLQETINLARNPSMYQELLRSNDRALRQLESTPGGFNALQRIYQEVQEPLIDAIQRNPYSEISNSNIDCQDTVNPQQGTENRDPLPNPWNDGRNSITNQPSESSQRSETLSNSSLFENVHQFLSPELINVLLNAYHDSQEFQTSSSLLNTLNVPFTPPNTIETSAIEETPRNESEYVSPEERYRSELEHLQHMGFNNAEANLQALIASEGDINRAIDRLLSST